MVEQIARGCGMVLLALLILGGGGWWYYRENDPLNARGHGSPRDRQAALLYAALQSGDTQSIDRLLTQQPKLLLERFGADGAALHVASRHNHPETIRLLLEWGADVGDTRCRFGATPLHWAAWWGSTDAAAELLKHGATVNAQAAMGTPLRWAVRSAELHRNPRADYAALAKLLLDAGADPNGGDPQGWTALIQQADPAVAALLQSHGAAFAAADKPSQFAQRPRK